MLEGWIIASSYGSTLIRSALISARMSRSLRSTRTTYPPSRSLGGSLCDRLETLAPPLGTIWRMPFHRYVALGDSFTEGVGDPDPARPNGLRGWADRVAEVLAERAG